MSDAPDLAAQLEALRADLCRELAEVIETQNERLLLRHAALKPLMRVRDVARTLGVSERTVETLVASGKLQPLWIKGQRRFHPDTVEAFIRAGERRARRRTRRAT